MKRNPSVELYRVLLMFGIVLLHCAGKGGVRFPWLDNLLKFCVTGFVFISGYFGIRFSWGKLGRLYALAATCAFAWAAIEWVHTGDVNLLGNVFSYMKSFWFLHAYAILMMFSQVLNLVVIQGGRKQIVMPIVVLVFGWSYLYEIGHFRPFVFPAAGLGSHTPLTLIGIYLLAQLFRAYNLDVRLPSKYLLLAVVLCVLFGIVGLAPYNSIFAFCMAAAFFVLFKRFVKCGNWVLLVAPSMFSVYLLHSTKPGLDFIVRHVSGDGIARLATMVLTAITLFVLCVGCDVLRRMGLLAIRRSFK